MDVDSETSKVENDDVSEDKPRLEPTGGDEEPVEESKKDEENDEEKADDNEGLDGLAIFAQQLNDRDRLVLYDKAVRLKRKGSFTNALQCFLCCLQGLKERNRFPVLPECLHHIADIYSKQEDYETAIQFAQAEKLYYETALITINRDEKPEPWDSIPYRKPASNINTTSQDQTFTQTAVSEEARKADEYEKLAHMCLKQKNPQLALDYCAKAVKLQQACYGEQHPTTLQTLDLFTVIYAEMGKQQYKAAMEKFTAAQEKEQQTKQSQQKEKEDKPEELKESNAKPLKTNIKSAGDGEVQQQSNPRTDDTVEITLTPSWAVVLYLAITVIITLVMTAILCYITDTDIHTTYSYMVKRLKFYYYYYYSKRQPSGGTQYF
ncbi:uncharacterized protein LOC110247210 [Exaiptasia diaphana]|uniref:Consortin N-terminal domain-containing protein n=1 Tax=Exaiptasia diaphana TaxID=2652724 RepID=A0A913XT06_EXADI|nr:uncharacterized protein LOC110247210 [Exaiptasia diaphana]